MLQRDRDAPTAWMGGVRVCVCVLRRWSVRPIRHGAAHLGSSVPAFGLERSRRGRLPRRDHRSVSPTKSLTSDPTPPHHTRTRDEAWRASLHNGLQAVQSPSRRQLQRHLPHMPRTARRQFGYPHRHGMRPCHAHVMPMQLHQIRGKALVASVDGVPGPGVHLRAPDWPRGTAVSCLQATPPADRQTHALDTKQCLQARAAASSAIRNIGVVAPRSEGGW